MHIPTLSKYGSFRVGEFFAVPYRHHLSKTVYHVIVGSQYHHSFRRVVARTPELAAMKAIDSYFEEWRELDYLENRKQRNINAERAKAAALLRKKRELDKLASKRTGRRIKRIPRRHQKSSERTDDSGGSSTAN